MYTETQREATQRVASLLEQSASKVANSLTGTAEEIRAVFSIPAQLARNAIWESEILPYNAFRILRRALEAEDAESIERLGASELRIGMSTSGFWRTNALCVMITAITGGEVLLTGPTTLILFPCGINRDINCPNPASHKNVWIRLPR